MWHSLRYLAAVLLRSDVVLVLGREAKEKPKRATVVEEEEEENRKLNEEGTARESILGRIKKAIFG